MFSTTVTHWSEWDTVAASLMKIDKYQFVCLDPQHDSTSGSSAASSSKGREDKKKKRRSKRSAHT